MAIRLPNGYGTVYKLKGNRRKPWIARAFMEWSADKRPVYYTIGYFASRRDALAALAEYHKNPIGERRDVTLGELYEEWFDGRYVNIKPEEKKKKFKSAEMYRTAWSHLSTLKNEKVRDVKTSHVQAVINDMQFKKNLSHSSCHKVKVLAGILFKYAMADDIITTNYAEMVEVASGEKQKQPETFSDIEIKKLEDKVKEVEWVDTILMFIYTGMRISEMLALTKFNVDLERMLITGGAKTDAGTDRIIPIHPKIQEYVRKWYNTEGTHLITRDGEQIRPDYYRRRLYYPALERVEVRRLTPHKARHTFGTLLSKAKVQTVLIQKLIGHADYATTANTYTHPEIEELKKAIAMI